MPVGPGYYRTTKSGVRLHFAPGGTVNEAKNMTSGKVHSPAEFAADRRRASAGALKRRTKRKAS